MSGETEFLLIVSGASLALYAVLVALPTGRKATSLSLAATGFLVIMTFVFMSEPPDSRYVDFGPLYRSFFAAALSGASTSAALYNVIRRNSGHSWVLRVAGVPAGVLAGVVIFLAVQALIA